MTFFARICMLLCLFSIGSVFAATVPSTSKIPVVYTVFTDALITFQVEGAILRAKLLKDESIPLVSINAKTQHGIVTLTGQVPKQSCVHAILQEAQFHLR